MSAPKKPNEPAKPAASIEKPKPTGSLPSAKSDGEDSAPKISFGQAPVWFIIICAILFMLGQVYLDGYAGDFSPKVYGPFVSLKELGDATPKISGPNIPKGAAVYTQCAACHKAGGEGTPGTAPPLAGSEWVTSPDPARLVRIVLYGLNGPIQVKGQEFNGTGSMPAWIDPLSSEDIANVVSYIRQAFGNTAPPVTTEDVEKIKKETPARNPWTAAEILAVPLKQ